MESLIQLQGITKTFSRSSFWSRGSSPVFTALEDIDLELKKGEILAILGESGSGKSTLARILTRLEQPDRGTLAWEGQAMGGRGHSRKERLRYGARVQMIFQDPFASLNGVHTVGYHIERPLRLHRPHLDRPALQKETIELLESVGLRPGASYLDKFPFELSGGQRQRVAIARALAVEPDLLIADEPTSMLDVSIRMDILNLLQGLRASRGLAIVLITHDLPSAWYLSDRVAVIYAGQIVESGPTASVLAEPAHPYTQLLLHVAKQKILRSRSSRHEAAPSKAALQRRDACLFAARCSRATDICKHSRPVLEALNPLRKARCYYPFAINQREPYDA